MKQNYFITGANGFIGAWIVKQLVERGDTIFVFDKSADQRRLQQIMPTENLAKVRFRPGDITDLAELRAALAESEASKIIHLAGLQVPACKADPPTGALVNVIGTLNVFEAARLNKIERVVYASSAAVFGQSESGEPLDENAASEPTTHYGVFKRANEGNARVYWADHNVSSVGLRPLTVYGVGRDSGLTSDPTKAMKAAVVNQPFHIRFGGATDFQFVADTAAAFVMCADSAPAGAFVFNLHGETVEIARIVKAINEELPESQRQLITFGGAPIPIAAALSDAAFRRTIGELPLTPLREGISQTMRRFAELRDAGQLDTSDLDA